MLEEEKDEIYTAYALHEIAQARSQMRTYGYSRDKISQQTLLDCYRLINSVLEYIKLVGEAEPQDKLTESQQTEEDLNVLNALKEVAALCCAIIEAKYISDGDF